jgi:CRP-like cAMP-binding protein
MSESSRITKTFAAGEALFEEGDTGGEAYLIKTGLVGITRVESGKKVNLAARSDGSIVGEMALIDDTVRSATVTAEQETVVEVICKDDLDAMVENVPEDLQVILSQLFESLRTANDLIGMYASRPAGE